MIACYSYAFEREAVVWFFKCCLSFHSLGLSTQTSVSYCPFSTSEFHVPESMILLTRILPLVVSLWWYLPILALQAASAECLKNIKASFPTSENFALTSGMDLGITIDMLKNLPSDTNIHQELRITALWLVGLSGDNYQNDVSWGCLPSLELERIVPKVCSPFQEHQHYLGTW